MENADSPDQTSKKATATKDELSKLLTEASNFFNTGDYEKCEETLNEVQTATAGQQHPILKHNYAVVKFYRTGCVDYATLLDEIDELTATPDDDGPSTSKRLAKPRVALGKNAVASYNRAVIYFHQHQYYTALGALEPLVEQLEKLEKHIGIQVAALQLQLLISTNELNKAEAFLDYLQSKLGYEANTPPALEDSNASDSSSSEAEANRSRKCEFQLLALLTQVLNRRPVAIPEQNSPDFAALKAHQYYIMKDFQMAAKQLLKIHNDCSAAGIENMALKTCIANNMGVIHLRVRHYAIAARFFQNAIEFDRQGLGDASKASLYKKGSARSCELMYNLGIAHLHLRKPLEAFKCLLIPLKFYPTNPRLWHRVAEACIMNYELVAEDLSSEKTRALPTRTNTSEAQPTLTFAAFALKNALAIAKICRSHFYEEPETEEDKPILAEDWRSAHDNNFCNPSNPCSKEALNQLLAAIYAAYSYVSLKLGDYLVALEMAQSLIKSENISDVHKFLGSMYINQALVQLKRSMEVRSYFDYTFVHTLNALDFETKDWQVKSLDAAQNIIRYNLAVALYSQNDLESAHQILVMLTHPIVARNAYAMLMHIESKVSEIRSLSLMKT